VVIDPILSLAPILTLIIPEASRIIINPIEVSNIPSSPTTRVVPRTDASLSRLALSV
jgi:hypothetical protein